MMNIKSTAHCQTGNSAVGVVYVLLNFLNKDGDEPDALGGDKDEALAQDIAQGMDDKEDKLKSKPATRFAITP